MNAPPKLAVAALRRVCSNEKRVEVEGDLMEAFQGWVALRGLSYARRRYWKEVVLLGGWRVSAAFRSSPIGPQPGSPHPPRGGRSGRLRDLSQDVRYGLRRLVKNPAASGVAILLLAIGVGGNAMVYTAVDQALMEPPPLIDSPEELVGLGWIVGSGNGVDFGYYDYEFYRDQGEAFDDVLAYGGFLGSRGRRTDEGGGEVAVGRGDGVEQAGAWVVSGNFFRFLGAPLGWGAGFSPGVQNAETEDPEVVISHGFWVRSFGADPSALDAPLYLNGVAFRIVGVTHPDFKGVNPGEPVPDIFVPILSAEHLSLGFRDSLERFQEDGSPSASRFLRLVARLQPGLGLEEAQAEALVLQRRWDDEFTSWAAEVYGENQKLQVRREFNMAPYEATALKRQLAFLWFVVGSVFLIGCANLAILLLASASGREREVGIRASLGASRRRILSQLVTESLVLSFLGGMAGLGLAYLAGGAITATLSMNFDGGFTPDASALAFVLLLSTLAAVLFGTAPAWKLSRVDVTNLIQRPGHNRTRAMFRGGLVVGQTVLSVLLLIVGGLLARSVQAAQQIDLGWEPDRKLVLSLQLDNLGYEEEEGRAFVQGALDRIAEVPGVRSATVANRLPFLGSNTWTFTAPGTDFAQEGLRTSLNLVGPDYFETVEMPIVAGRGFTRDDDPSGPRSVVVNQIFADRFWPGENPLGRTLDFIDESWRVVGVSKTAVYHNVMEAPRPHAYFSSLQLYQGMISFIVATQPPPSAMIAPVEEALREFDATLAMGRMTLAGLVDEQLSPFRIWTALIGVMASVALFLALVGLYGVQSYLVSRRTKEIGIRMAMGAEAGSVVRGVVKSGLIMGGIGALVGVAMALALSRFMRGFLFGVGPNDPLVFTVVPVLMLSACLLASLIPAMRASRVNPVEALRRE